jgi:hypothetical protein
MSPMLISFPAQHTLLYLITLITFEEVFIIYLFYRLLLFSVQLSVPFHKLHNEHDSLDGGPEEAFHYVNNTSYNIHYVTHVRKTR